MKQILTIAVLGLCAMATTVAAQSGSEDDNSRLERLVQRAEDVGSIQWREASPLITDSSVRTALREKAVAVVAASGDRAAKQLLLKYLTNEAEASQDAALQHVVRWSLVSLAAMSESERNIDAELSRNIAGLMEIVFGHHVERMVDVEPFDHLVMRLDSDRQAQQRAAVALYRGSMRGGTLRSRVHLPASFLDELTDRFRASIAQPDSFSRFDMKAARTLALRGVTASLPVFDDALTAIDDDLRRAHSPDRKLAEDIRDSVKALSKVRSELEALVDLLEAHQSAQALIEYAQDEREAVHAYRIDALIAAESRGASLLQVRQALEQIREHVLASEDRAAIVLGSIKDRAIEQGWLSAADWPEAVNPGGGFKK